MNLLDVRRRAPRIHIDGFCAVAAGDDFTHATMTELSALGLKLERPFDPKAARPVVQLEIDLPGLDEVVWTTAHVTRAVLTPMGGRTADGQPRFWVKAGLVLGEASRREKRLLRDYVIEKLVTRTATIVS